MMMIFMGDYQRNVNQMKCLTSQLHLVQLQSVQGNSRKPHAAINATLYLSFHLSLVLSFFLYASLQFTE